MNSAQVEASYKEQWKKNNWKQLQQQDKKKQNKILNEFVMYLIKGNYSLICYDA